MSRITLRGMGGPLDLQSNGSFQSASPLSSTPGAYGTSATVDVAQLVGTRWDLSDGREVILVSTGSSTTTAAGFVYQDAAIVANHQSLTVTAFNPYGESGGVANSSSTPATVTVTLGATALAANQYQGGFLIVNSGAGIGQTLRIASNPAALASATGVVITLEDAPNTALTTASVVSLVPAHGANVIEAPTTLTNAVVGVALYPIAPSMYGFLVSKGLVAAVSDASVASVGEPISPSSTTAGTVTLTTASSTDVTKAVIGYAAQGATSADASLVFVNL